MPVFDFAVITVFLINLVKKLVYLVPLLVFLALVLSMFASFVIAFTGLYNLTNTLLSYVSGGGSGELVSKMFGLLSCMGFTQAFNDTKVYIIGAFLFYFWRILFAQIISVYYKLLTTAQGLLK